MNEVTIVGNTVHAPEIKFAGGVPTTTFAVAVNRRFQKNGAWTEDVSYFDVTCWRELAENVVASLGVGDRVIVSGRLEQQRWEGSDGKTRSKIVLMANEVGAAMRFAVVEVYKNEKGQRGERVTDETPF